MPLGISESLIQRAYAPVDLSGFYNGINQAAKIAAAEQRAEQKEAKKQYYVDLVAANKGKDAVRDVDAPLITEYFNKYKKIKTGLINNPKLKERNPEEYYKLDSEAEEYLSKARVGIKKSKDIDQFLSGLSKSYITNKNKLNDDFSEKYNTAKIMNYNDIENSGLTDISNWAYQGPDLNKYSNNINAIYNESFDKNIKKVKKITPYGTEIADIVETINPSKLIGGLNNYISDEGRNAPKVADYIMTEAFKTGEVDRYWNAFTSLNDKDLGKLGIAKPSGNTTADFKNFLLIKGIVDRPTKITTLDKEFYPDGREVVNMQVFKQKKAIDFDYSKRRIDYAQKYKTVDTSLTDLAAGVYTLLGKDNEKADKAIKMIPNGYENGLYFYGADPVKYKNGYKAIAAQMNLPVTDDKLYNLAVKKIQKTPAADIARIVGSTEEDIKSGVLTSGADQAGVYKSKIFDKSEVGENSFLATNLTAFGTPAKKEALKLIGTNILNLFEQPESAPSNKAKKTQKVGPTYQGLDANNNPIYK